MTDHPWDQIAFLQIRYGDIQLNEQVFLNVFVFYFYLVGVRSKVKGCEGTGTFISSRVNQRCWVNDTCHHKSVRSVSGHHHFCLGETSSFFGTTHTRKDHVKWMSEWSVAPTFSIIGFELRWYEYVDSDTIYCEFHIVIVYGMKNFIRKIKLPPPKEKMSKKSRQSSCIDTASFSFTCPSVRVVLLFLNAYLSLCFQMNFLFYYLR